jgi:hypothetical protein
MRIRKPHTEDVSPTKLLEAAHATHQQDNSSTNLDVVHAEIDSPCLHEQLVKLPFVLCLRPELRQRCIALCFGRKRNTRGVGWREETAACARVRPAQLE